MKIKYPSARVCLAIFILSMSFDALAGCTITVKDVYFGQDIQIPFTLSPLKNKSDNSKLRSSEEGVLKISDENMRTYAKTVFQLEFVINLQKKLYAKQLLKNGEAVEKIEKNGQKGYTLGILCKKPSNGFTVQRLAMGRKAR